MIATSTADKNTLFFKSPFLNAEEGNTSWRNVTPSLTRSLLITTLHLPVKQAAAAAAAAIQNCNFRQPNFSEIYSWTKEPWTYFLLGHYDTVNDSIVLNAAIPKLVWQHYYYKRSV
jgi:hypothetical protein